MNYSGSSITESGTSGARGRNVQVLSFMSIKTQFENVGDALIVRELVRLMAERSRAVVDLSRCPEEFRRTLALENIANVRVLRVIGFARLVWLIVLGRARGMRCYYFLVPGGIRGEKRVIHAVRHVAYTLFLFLLRTIGVSLCHVGISYDNLGPRHARLLRLRALVLSAHVVRDRLSAFHLTEHGVRVDAVVPDLAFNLIDERLQANSRRDAVAVSFRCDKYPEKRAEIVEFVERIIQERSEGRQKPLDVRFVSQVRRDDSFMSDLWRHFSSDRRVSASLHLCSGDIEECRRIYADCASVYSNRLHALLIGLSCGAVPYAVVDRSADAKIVGVFESIGMLGFVLDLGTSHQPVVVTSEVAWDEVTAARRRLREYFDELICAPMTI